MILPSPEHTRTTFMLLDETLFLFGHKGGQTFFRDLFTERNNKDDVFISIRMNEKLDLSFYLRKSYNDKLSLNPVKGINLDLEELIELLNKRIKRIAVVVRNPKDIILSGFSQNLIDWSNRTANFPERNIELFTSDINNVLNSPKHLGRNFQAMYLALTLLKENASLLCYPVSLINLDNNLGALENFLTEHNIGLPRNFEKSKHSSGKLKCIFNEWIKNNPNDDVSKFYKMLLVNNTKYFSLIRNLIYELQ